VSNIVRNLDLIANILAERLDRDHRVATKAELTRRVESIVEQLYQQHTNEPGLHFLVADADGYVIAGAPKTPALGRPLLDTLGLQPPPTLGAPAGVRNIPPADGPPAFATGRPLSPPLGQLAVIQERAAALTFSRSDTALTVTLSATTGFVVLILGF